MSYGVDDNYGLAEDVAVYSFESLGQDDNLGGLLLDDSYDTFNQDTFDTEPIGRDFDFAGNTNRLLDDRPPGVGGQQQQQQQHHQLQPLDSSWTTPAAGDRQQHQQQQPSPWNSLDADPLLSRTPLPRSQYAPGPAQQPPQQRTMRTLDEIEAEMRAQQAATAAAAAATQPPAPPGRPLTLEEVEAEMLRNARAPVQQQLQQQQPLPPHLAQHQQQPQQQPFYGASPQLQSAYPPPPPGHFPPPYAMPGQQFPHPHQPFPHPGQLLQPRPGSVGGVPGFPPGMLPPPPPAQAGQSPAMRPQQPPPGQPGPPPNPLTGPPNMMATLFPPLPSQGGIAAVEQQLQYLTMNQHAQHPSLTGAQLQALLQQAQYQAAKEASATEVGGDVDVSDDAQAQAKAAGEQLIRNVEQRILEHEMLEQKRKRKAAKIASMTKHNNLMSNSDKDFITRIQVSQLVTDDPYADDFYFHIMLAIKNSRMNAAMNAGAPPGAMVHNGPGAGPGGPRLGPGGNNNNNNNRKPTRRENAMNKMAQNVQRLVDVAKQRNKSGQLSLDGALGKIALRTRSAPRQLLQVKTDAGSSSLAPSTGHALLAGLISQSDAVAALPGAEATANGVPLSHRAVLTIVERIYDSVLDLEQLRRIQPALYGAQAVLKEQQANAPEGALDEQLAAATLALEESDAKYAELVDKLWTNLRVMDPLDSSVPHPFISLVSVLKGKRILPRALRHLSPEQTLTLVTLIVATFDTLDTVRDAPLLDASDDLNKLSTGSLEAKQRRAAVETKTEAFLNAIIAPVMGVIGQAPLRMVTGMLGLMMERNDLTKVVHSKPGIAFLTIFLSRAESLKQATPAPDAQDLAQWQQTFDHLFNSLVNSLPSLFPSTRAVSSLPFGSAYYLSGQAASSINAVRPDVDLDDEPVWRFLAAMAVCADPNEQQSLVTNVRDKVLENVTSANKARVAPEVAALKIRNVNLLLHSLGLDASQLTAEE